MPKFTEADYSPDALRSLAKILVEFGGRIQAEASRLESLQLGAITVRCEDSKVRALELLGRFEDAIPAAIQRELREKSEGPKPKSPAGEKQKKKPKPEKSDA